MFHRDRCHPKYTKLTTEPALSIHRNLPSRSTTRSRGLRLMILACCAGLANALRLLLN